MCLLRPSFFLVLLALCSGEEENTSSEQAPNVNNCTEDGSLIVHVEQGDLQGQCKESAAGGFLICFQGVPYAEPPLDDLRFKDALPPRKWDGVRPALKEGNICPQLRATVEGNEDCLYLNVYTPAHPPKENSPFPVMVWIHGGGYTYGSGNRDTYGPDYLVSEEVIVVTMNYRLGVLGFLYLREAVPGNVGLKDQVAAMRWVKKNIAAFNGDPDRITIFGQSAGGASVHLHMLSPMTEGLFHAAISQSGNSPDRWGIPTDPLNTSLHLATQFDCPVENYSATADCLRKVDVDKLMEKASSREIVAEEDKERIMLFDFVPTVDLQVPRVETFLPAHPTQLMAEGKHKAVPLCTGFTNNESLLLSAFENFFNESIAKEIDVKWDTKILPELSLPINGSKQMDALRSLRRFFMNGKSLTNDTFAGFLDMLTDIHFGKADYYTLDLMAHFRKAALYSYYFTEDDSLNAGKVEDNLLNRLGASHGDDLGYLFNMTFLPKVSKYSSAWNSRTRMVRLWTNFAKYRNPTPYFDPLLGELWETYSQDDTNYLEIGSKLSSGKDLNCERVNFWRNFYETYEEKM